VEFYSDGVHGSCDNGSVQEREEQSYTDTGTSMVSLKLLFDEDCAYLI
jgi:hypothetical protein